VWGKRDDMVVHEVDPYNAEPPPAALAGEDITPLDTFYSRNHGPVPEVDPDGWTLRVDGLVDRPATFGLDDLRRMFVEHDETATLQCAGNRRAGLIEVRDIPGEAPWGPAATATARWTGIRLADLLRHVGVHHEATHVAFTGADVATSPDTGGPFGGSIPARKALMPEVLLAWSMNGAPLPAIHGAPVRIVAPGYIGARSVKWLERITVRDTPSDNFFQTSTYRLLPPDVDPSNTGPGDGVALGLVAVNSDVLRPDHDARVPVGPIAVTGYAFAGGDRTVVRVDVSSDNGRTWSQAELADQLSPWAWRHWSATVEVPRGAVTVLARAWDSSAALQPERPEYVWNPKGYVNNSWARVRLYGV
jgi:sulfite oxidase